ncbi:MAG: DUF4351 domain-containing protein [Synechococcaceae cyanobacterium]
MGGLTLEDFTQSVAYREIFGLGEQQGLLAGQLDITLRLPRRRCGGLSPEQDAQIRSLPRRKLEALAEALLDFQGPDDLKAWLAAGSAGPPSIATQLQPARTGGGYGINHSVEIRATRR